MSRATAPRSSSRCAVRSPPQAEEIFNPPNWDIWEYVRRVPIHARSIRTDLPTSDPTGTGSQYVSPHYLPDGRILFATTRQFDSGAVLLNEGKPEFEEQTEDLNRIGVRAARDEPRRHRPAPDHFQPEPRYRCHACSPNGRVMFTRWDHANGNDGMHLYTANPDGTDVQLLYGEGSHNDRQHQSRRPGRAARTARTARSSSCARARCRAGRCWRWCARYTDADCGGNLEIINRRHFVENNQSRHRIAPRATAATRPPRSPSRPRPQNDVLTAVTPRNLPVISPGGRFTSAFPLWDGSGRILVTWSECRLQNTAGTILPCTSANLADATLTAGAGALQRLDVRPGGQHLHAADHADRGRVRHRHRRTAAAHHARPTSAIATIRPPHRSASSTSAASTTGTARPAPAAPPRAM